MLRRCKYCGKQYAGDPSGSCCPACAAAQRKTSLRDRACVLCGTTFSGGPSALYCPDCRRDRQREADRRQKRNGARRPLGSMDRCRVCEAPYTVSGSNQKYCPACAADAIRAVDRAASLQWSAAHTTPAQRQEERRAAAVPIPCVVCGKLFPPTNAAQTCSTACSAVLKKRRQAQWELEHRAERNQRRRDRRAAKVRSLSPEACAAYRAEVNARARENYAKRKKEAHHD